MEEHSNDLRAALEASFDAATTTSGGGADTQAAPVAPEQASAGSGGPQRDASGRFAPSGGDEGGAGDAGASAGGAEAEPELPDGYDPDVWALLTPDARAKTAGWAGKQRETVAERDARLAKYAPIDAVLAKRRDGLVAQFGSEDRALEQLFHLSDWAGRDFPGFVRYLAQQRGIDLATIMPQRQEPGQGQQEQAPDIRRLVADLVAEQTVAGQVDRDFEQFQADASLEHRSDPGIRRTMAALLQANVAADYRQAYAMAAQAHPVIGPKLRSAEAAAAAKADTERNAKAAKGKADAAVSTVGAPGTARAPASDAAPSTLRGQLEAAFAAQDGRV